MQGLYDKYQCPTCKRHVFMVLKSGRCHKCIWDENKKHHGKDDIKGQLNEILERVLKRQEQRSAEEIEDYNRKVEREDKMTKLRAKGIPESILRMLIGGGDGESLLRDVACQSKLSAALGDGNRIIFLSGPTGTGKTTAVARLVADSAYSQMYGATSARDKVERIKEISYLVVIDDVGAEASEDRRFIDEILQCRHATMATTVCTTNLSWAEFADTYNPRTISRICEVGAFIPVNDIVRPGNGLNQ